jgi:hypothetical protein
MVTDSGTVISIPVIVQDLTQYFRSLWWGSNSGFPILSPGYNYREQKEKGQKLDVLAGELIDLVKHNHQNDREKLQARDAFLEKAEAFLIGELGFDKKHTDTIRKYRLAEIIQEFAKKARTFDPQITGEDIYQASRNVWSMNFMQILLGINVELTPSIIAYSLLYPYTDNYLDDPAVTPQFKINFNQRFTQRLTGDLVPPINKKEELIWQLIGMVENQFERRKYPLVYEALAAIQEAQTRSLGLIRPAASPYEVDVLGISIEKGGSAVLADGYLVAGELNAIQREFMFGYGAFTQLMDDQEDFREDMKAGLNTVYSQTARHWLLDEVTNRTFHFARNVLKFMDNFEGADVLTLKELFTRGIDLLLIDAAGRNGRYYSKNYLNELEKFLPFRFSDINQQRRRLKRNKISLEKLLALSL